MRRVLLALSLLLAALAVPAVSTAAYAAPGPGQAQACTTAGVCAGVGVIGVSFDDADGNLPVLQYAVTVDGPVTTASFRTHQDPDAPIDPATVVVKGVAPPVGAVTVSGPDVIVDLIAADGLGIDIVVGFALLPTAAPSPVVRVSWADVTITDTQVDPAEQVTATSDDAVIPTGSGPDVYVEINTTDPVPVPRGAAESASLIGKASILVGREGPDPAPSILTLTFPGGVALGPDGVYDSELDETLACTPTTASTVDCAIDPDFSYLEIDLLADPSLPIGATLTLQVSIAPVEGGDADSSDNLVTVPLVIVGTADLVVTVTPAGTITDPVQLPAAAPVSFTVTVTNGGPDPATGVLLAVGLFLDTGEITLEDPYAGPDLTATGLGTPEIGTLQPGESRSRTVVVTGLRVGATPLLVTAAGGDTFDPVELCDTPSCLFPGAVPLIVVPALTPTPPPTQGVPPAQGAPPLAIAETGVDVGGLRTAGIALLAAGMALSWLGRRRQTRAA